MTYQLILSGHGSWSPEDGYIELPADRELWFYAEFAKLLPDEVGQLVETLGDQLSKLERWVVHGGSTCPNYKLSPPDRLDTIDISTIDELAGKYKQLLLPESDEPVHLGDVLADGRWSDCNVLHWGACLALNLKEKGGAFIGVNARAESDGLDAAERARVPSYRKNRDKGLSAEALPGHRFARGYDAVLSEFDVAAREGYLESLFLSYDQDTRRHLFMNDAIKWFLLDHGISRELIEAPTKRMGTAVDNAVFNPAVTVLQDTGYSDFPKVENFDINSLKVISIDLLEYGILGTNSFHFDCWHRPDVIEAPFLIGDFKGSGPALAYESDVRYANSDNYAWYAPPRGLGVNPNCAVHGNRQDMTARVEFLGHFSRDDAARYIDELLNGRHEYEMVINDDHQVVYEKKERESADKPFRVEVSFVL
ncbi:putative adhesin [Lentzea sp. NEAU-D7]|uniref:putative adhesin n=1 Tax=Lentzea sp. NEAU-D7 TaxID=2994667 RepID=UPI00224A58A8|nr:hypothetical protein [Lentzea sp. NEAU-D7]MCX2954556.1 hypothetical protein [Lentzea sp. NEAU-D7]